MNRFGNRFIRFSSSASNTKIRSQALSSDYGMFVGRRDRESSLSWASSKDSIEKGSSTEERCFKAQKEDKTGRNILRAVAE